MARTNPGGSADYTLRSIDGSSLTLSDLVRGNPNPIEVEIVMAGYGGVSYPRGVPPTDLLQVQVSQEAVTLFQHFYQKTWIRS